MLGLSEVAYSRLILERPEYCPLLIFGPTQKATKGKLACMPGHASSWLSYPLLKCYCYTYDAPIAIQYNLLN